MLNALVYYLVGMQPNQLAARAHNMKTGEDRARGQQRKRWIDGITDTKKTQTHTCPGLPPCTC